MRIIIINPETQTIEEANIRYTLKNLQAIVGGLIQSGHMFSPTEEVYVNEEGLFGDRSYWFHIKGAHQPFVGKGFIVGIDSEKADFVSTKMTVAKVRSLVSFLDNKNGTVLIAIS